jgi:hypothetical protein
MVWDNVPGNTCLQFVWDTSSPDRSWLRNDVLKCMMPINMPYLVLRTCEVNFIKEVRTKRDFFSQLYSHLLSDLNEPFHFQSFRERMSILGFDDHAVVSRTDIFPCGRPTTFYFTKKRDRQTVLGFSNMLASTRIRFEL